MILKGNLVDVFTEDIYPAEVTFDRHILSVERIHEELPHYILPGFIDAHIHLESSMLCPSRFAEAVIPHGTTCCISDPHEIANVMGVKGIDYMIRDTSILKIHYTAPSCVPATTFETSGAAITSQDIEELFKTYDLISLGEVMNVPGVIFKDKEISAKIGIAKKYGKPIDGHAPGLSGPSLREYVSQGISTDHECTSVKEAREKQGLGMKIMIREGTASKNLKDLLGLDYDNCFLVSDDLHPEDLKKGHIDILLEKAVSYGIDPVKAVKMVTVNPAEHYRLETGILTGRPADMVVVEDLSHFAVKKVFIDGELVAQDSNPLFSVSPESGENTFRVNHKSKEDFRVEAEDNARVRVIKVIEGSLYTKEDQAVLPCQGGNVVSDVDHDVLKLVVVERYGHNYTGIGFVKGFGLEKGALASSVSHDSHNILGVGVSDKDIEKAVNTIIDMRGGITACCDRKVSLNLPVAGLMSLEPSGAVAETHKRVQDYAEELGCTLENPFMQLSFLSLLVIPELKLSDRGLFDSRRFQFVEVIL